jgi:hypothetical protein
MGVPTAEIVCVPVFVCLHTICVCVRVCVCVYACIDLLNGGWSVGVSVQQCDSVMRALVEE